MKYSLMAFAVMATLATGVMAQDNAAGGQQRQRPQLTPEQIEQRQTQQLERIKGQNEELYKELVALKAKDKEAFQKKLDEYNETQFLERLKTRNEAQYNELMALKEKDKEAYQKKLAELRQAGRGQGGQGGQGGQRQRPAQN